LGIYLYSYQSVHGQIKPTNEIRCVALDDCITMKMPAQTFGIC
jgi:hypothetical protein